MPEDVSSSGPRPALPDVVRAYGKYFLIRKLAEGGMAEIFLAKQVGAEGFERNVVIKRMLQHLSAVPDFVGMFLDEARLAARLAHPNITAINDLGLADGCYYICMEYQPGEDFSTVLRTASRRREYVPIEVAVRVVTEAAHGLHFAHEFTDESGKPLNIVHRDISPSNIYVTYQGQAKLLDFGIAKAESRVTQTTAGVVKGKYMYMAPEQAGTGMVDRRADVFSLGVTLYESLTNTRPFARDSDLAILNAVLKGDFKQPRAVRPDLPQELEVIVLKAMAHDKDARYPTTAAMASDLERYLAASTSAAGGSRVAVYLKSLFGEERMREKSRIPTLQSLAQAGADVPGLNRGRSITDSTRIETGKVSTAKTEAGTMAVAPPTAVPVRSRMLYVLTGIVGLVAGAGLLIGIKDYLDRQNTVVVPPPLGLGAVDAGAAVAPPDAGDVAVVRTEPPDAGRHPGTPQKPEDKPVFLTEAMVEQGVARQYLKASACFSEYRDDVPEAPGKALVTFIVQRSGRTTEVSIDAPFAEKPAGKCFARRIATWAFPRNYNGPLKFRFPLGYRRE